MFTLSSLPKGFLAEDEGLRLHALALEQSKLGPCLELGSYCGLSTVYVGQACKQSGNTLYALDHHRGSEEHQQGEAYHDAELYDVTRGVMDSFPEFRHTLQRFELTDHVVPIVASSEIVMRDWATPLSMVFIDGGHSEAMALKDCLGWAKHLVSGGILAVHDIFSDPSEGGQGPYLALQAVLSGGDFELLPQTRSLGVLRKK